MEPVDKAHWQTLAMLMRDLQKSPGWEALVKQLEEQENTALQQLVFQPTERKAGYIEGLRAAFHLPQWVIDKAKQL